MKNIIDGFSYTSSMGVLAALTSALTAFNPKSVNVDNEKEMHRMFVKQWVNFLLLQRTYKKAWGIL
jgi:citrate synthase